MKGLGKSSHVFQLHPSTPENFNLNSELAHLIFANLLQLFGKVTEGSLLRKSKLIRSDFLLLNNF